MGNLPPKKVLCSNPTSVVHHPYTQPLNLTSKHPSIQTSIHPSIHPYIHPNILPSFQRKGGGGGRRVNDWVVDAVSERSRRPLPPLSLLSLDILLRRSAFDSISSLSCHFFSCFAFCLFFFFFFLLFDSCTRSDLSISISMG